MKILLITESLGSGGAERQLTGLAVLLKSRGYNVKVITYLDWQFYEPFLRQHKVDYELRPELLNRVKRVFYLVKILRHESPDVVISYLPSVNISMCLARIFYPCDLIVSERSHTMNFDWKIKIRYNVYRIAKWIVPNSVSEADNIREHFSFLRKKIKPIPNFVDVEHFCPLLDKKVNDIPIILCVGRLIPSKNVLRLIEAAKILVENKMKFKIIWIGNQYDIQYLAEVKNKITQYDLNDVFLLKDQTDDILNEYQRADYFCLPTLYEGYPNVICEAMSCGLPVICSNICENPKIVKDGINGFLFNPFCIEDIVKSIIKMLSLDPFLLDEIRKNNRNSIIKNNSSNCFVENYINLFVR